uniref:Uncharacterized protein n=1 Tax=Globodera rostochiensis TaxID=31243 RepID=A0A914H948_GLORO
MHSFNQRTALFSLLEGCDREIVLIIRRHVLQRTNTILPELISEMKRFKSKSIKNSSMSSAKNNSHQIQLLDRFGVQNSPELEDNLFDEVIDLNRILGEVTGTEFETFSAVKKLKRIFKAHLPNLLPLSTYSRFALHNGLMSEIYLK